ncbi:argininosuccinate lyase, partial [Brachionus plicatilis]
MEDARNESNRNYSLWGGRFSNEPSDLMKKFNSSLRIDKRLWKQDLTGSKAWARAIQRVGLIDQNELDKIILGLDKISEEWESGCFSAKDDDEDIHTANERRLRELIGDAAMKLHTGRSRNDQVITDVRLWLMQNLDLLKENLKILIKTAVVRAEKEIDVLMSGYTHLQRAQPIRFSHLLLSYVSALDRDFDRIVQFFQRVNICPLGSGAIAGNPFNIDRKRLADDLNFSGPTINSIDSTANRDLIYEFLFLCTSIGLSLGKFAEDFIIYNTKEFSFIELSDSFCTGSSLMPQKKNADSLELIRGKTGRLFGRMSGFMMTVKAIPTSYNKDLQEDKEALFDSFDTVTSIIRIATGVIESLKINKDNMAKSLSVDMLATDLAYYLVRKGVPFRAAHSLAGKCVGLAEQKKCSIKDLSIEDLAEISPFFEKDVVEIYDFEKSVEQYTSIGGTAKNAVLEQINTFKTK